MQTSAIKTLCCAAAILPALTCVTAWADGSTNTDGGALSKTLNLDNDAPSSKRWDIYLSGYARHDRSTYSDQQLSKLNETTWGGGLGRTVRNESGNDESMYLMGIRDSKYRPMWMAGYAYQWVFAAKSSNLEVSAGLTGAILRRNDWCNGHPFPAVLPVMSIGARSAKLIMTYIPPLPTKRAKGNILQMMLQLSI